MTDSITTVRSDKKAMPILSTLVYCLENNQVLLMRRKKEPNLGLWVAPGGKVEAGESPYDCAARELQEETGLKANKLRFRGLITEVSPQPDWQWMLFLYVTNDFSGNLIGDHREGEFSWWPVEETDNLSIPQSDRIFYPKVIDFSQPFYQAKYLYDAKLDLVKVIEQ